MFGKFVSKIGVCRAKVDHGDGVSRPFFDPLTPSLRATKISDNFGFVELIQGFYHPWDKMACVGGTEKFVGRINLQTGVARRKAT